MDIYCTRPSCPRPVNYFADLDDNATLKTVQQKFCTACGMPLILIGRYLPSKLLGQGGFGTAYLARDRYTPAMRQCVVKQFQPSGDLNPTQLATAQSLFEREGAVLEELGTHPQIPDLFAFFELTVPSFPPGGQAKKFFYLVQEFINGQDLEAELAQKGQLSEEEVLEVLLKILPVLQFVHENHSIHRDIKPSNIMRHRNGRLYLLDFGAVKQVTKVVAAGGSQGSTGIYSMGFAPPEQMAGGEVYPSTDLYALAVTCITLLTGKQPIELFDSYNNQWNWQPYAQLSGRGASPEENRLAAVLDRMLLSTPNQRFQSAAEVVTALTAKVSHPVTPGNLPPSVSVTSSGAASTPSSPAAASQSVASPVQQPPSAPQRASRSAFSTLELLGGAAFTGFEGGLLAIALTSLFSVPSISYGLLGLIMAGLVFAQARRLIEKVDLVIIAGVTLALVYFLPTFHLVMVDSLGIRQILQGILFVAGLSGLVAIAITALFRLVYKLLSHML